MAALTGADVLRGDILLCKSFSMLPNATHWVIRSGQNAFPPETDGVDTPIAGRTFTSSVHAEMAISSGEDPVRIVESTGAGLTRGAHEDVEAYVFRLRKAYPDAKRLAAAAADMAEDLVDWTAGKATGHYNYFRSAYSVLGDQSFDDKAKERLRQIRDKTYKNGFFCSMLVTVCYQIAADELKLPRPPIEADPMNLSPSGLEAYMRRFKDVWACIGILNRPEGGLLGRWKKRLLTSEW
jgi:hypothetical protein